MNDFRPLYDKYLNEIETLLTEYIPEKSPEILYDPFRYIVSGGGKRIRPVLTMISCGAVGADPYSAKYTGAAIEIMHNFTLVHDDIMDESPIRRGKETIHLKWDEATAILAGDVMVGYAYRLIENYNEHKNLSKIYTTLTHGLIEVCEGQVFDMTFNDKSDVSVDDYILTITKKTAKILETCTLMGAYVGNADAVQLEALSNYAINLGIAFQIQDDILDLTADEAALGKHIGQDIIEGKKTWLMIKARERAENDEHMELINRFYKSNGLEENDIADVRNMLISLDVIKDAETEAQKYFAQAKDSIANLEQNEHQQMLIWLADSLNKRKY